MLLLKARIGAAAPKLKVHGYVGIDDLAAIKELAARSGLQHDIVWLNHIDMPQVFREYASSQLCVLPYTASCAGLAASTASAVGLPVIGTRHAGNIEHLGEEGVWIEKDDAEQLAAQIQRLLASPELCRDLSRRLRRRAEEHLNWDVIADATLGVYQRAIEKKASAERAVHA
jgi:glycosyltransferase involved in cell wall biosynthesis